MAITVCPVTAGFAAEIGDVDVSRQLEPAEVESIKQAFWDYSVLIFPGQELRRSSISNSRGISVRSRPLSRR